MSLSMCLSIESVMGLIMISISVQAEMHDATRYEFHCFVTVQHSNYSAPNSSFNLKIYCSVFIALISRPTCCLEIATCRVCYAYVTAYVILSGLSALIIHSLSSEFLFFHSPGNFSFSGHSLSVNFFHLLADPWIQKKKS